MNKILKAAGRFALVSCVAFGGATIANRQHHENYWNGTIKRVQTVDFNMLSHILPTKLSLALMSGNEQEVQRTLDSNYGLFGLVVTDCETAEVQCNQSILYSSESSLPWKDSLNLATLQASDFDVLRDPPPLYPEGYYEGPRAPERQATQLSNDGEIIGRVYYVRGGAPDFYEAYAKWMKGWPNSFLSDSGVNKYFALTTILFFLGGSATFLFIELLIRDHARKQELLKIEHNRQQEDLEIEKSSLEKEAAELRTQIEDLTNQIYNSQSLIESLNESLTLSKESADNLNDMKLRLEEEISALEQEFKKEREDLEHLIEELASQSQASEHQINELQSQLQLEKSKLQEETDSSSRLREVLSHQNARKAHTDKKLREARVRLKAIEESDLGRLKSQLEAINNLRANEIKERAMLKKALKKAEEEREIAQSKFETLNERLEHQQTPPCNQFETSVVKALKTFRDEHQGHWSVLDSIDVAPRGSNSMLTDCLVIGTSCVIAVEAKGYSGKIAPERDTRNSSWFSTEKSSRPRLINSSWGQNPYLQVKTYAEYALKKIKVRIPPYQAESRNKIMYFGIVVFPDAADLSKLGADLGKHYRVIHYSELGDTLLEIEKLVSQQGKPSKESFSFQDLERYLFGGGDCLPAKS